MNLIVNYINKVDINTINDFALKNNIFLNKKELDIIYDILKNRYEEVLYGDDSKVRKYLKENLSLDNYERIINLFDEYKEKYDNYLLWFIILVKRFSSNSFCFIISISSLYGGYDILSLGFSLT